MRRLLASLAVAALAGCVTLGSAASLHVPDTALSAGSAAVSACDDDGLRIHYRLSWRGGFSIDRIDVGGIDDRCVGLSITLAMIVAGEAVELDPVRIPATGTDDNEVQLPVPGNVPAVGLERVHIAIT
jgi:hypothetical protein